MLQERVESLSQRRELLAEESRIELLHQPPQNDERLDLLRREPEPGQLVGRALRAGDVAIAARVAVELDRRAEVVPRLGDQPEHGRG